MDVYEFMCVFVYLHGYLVVDCVTPLANIVVFSKELHSSTFRYVFVCVQVSEIWICMCL